MGKVGMRGWIPIQTENAGAEGIMEQGGGRVWNSEVTSLGSRIPSGNNSPKGRRELELKADVGMGIKGWEAPWRKIPWESGS